MKNIHLIPTDKPSRLYLHSNNELQLRTNIIRTSEDYLGTNQNIYISSDEEIKEGDWIILDNSIKELPEYQGLHVIQIVDNTSLKSAIALNCKKIILTTDQDLIADSVQAIDDTFLEWFVKNPSCEYVNVKDFPTTEKYNSKGEYIHNSNWIYKIIIPKEEPKPIHQQIIYIVGGEDRFREIANLKPKQETLKKVEENIDREEWIHFFKNNSKEEILEYLIKYKFPL
jgi:hypothetical protein